MSWDQDLQRWHENQRKHTIRVAQDAVVAAAEALIGPIILPTASSALANAVRDLRIAEGRLFESWTWFYANPVADHDTGDEG
jgi:hypothetical protein